jgi:hypothetical protein
VLHRITHGGTAGRHPVLVQKALMRNRLTGDEHSRPLRVVRRDVYFLNHILSARDFNRLTDGVMSSVHNPPNSLQEESAIIVLVTQIYRFTGALWSK